MASTFDLTAASFDRHRAFPAGVPEAIRKAIWNSLPQPPERILDLGAGTGRIGKAFVQTNDFYIGIDLSWAMLREFAAQSPGASLLQADGQCLPFADHVFDLVLLMQVLSGMADWTCLLQETLRVLTSPGVVVVGQAAAPDSGVDARLIRQLDVILEEMGIAVHKPRKSRRSALAWLESRASQHETVTAAQWTAQRSPEQFIARHRTGARFAALPPAIQNEGLEKLSTWAKANFGSLAKAFTEEHSFELDIFRIG